MKTSGPKGARKPPAPARAGSQPRNPGQTHGHPLTHLRREERVHPSLRKAKHKHGREEAEEPNEE